MFLETLPDELIICIINYLSTNKESYSLIISSKTLYSISKRCGFLKKIECKNSPQQISLHRHTLKTIVSVNYIPSIWVKNMHFKNCGYPEIFPLSTVETENLIYTDFKPGKLRIDWKKFPKLKNVTICVSSIENTDFSPLVNLEFLYIKTFAGEYTKEDKNKPIRFFSKLQEKPDMPVITLVHLFSRMRS